MSIDLASELRVMVGNAPATRSYVTDLYTRAADEIEALRARLEKAEAERDAARAVTVIQTDAFEKAKSGYRNDALEEAAQVVKNEPMRFAGQTESAVRASLSSAIRALKDKS
jgi:hypothetical protein